VLLAVCLRAASWGPCYLLFIVRPYVQRQLTKRLKGRFTQVDIDSLYCRRIKSDLLMCYKILNNLVCIDVDSFFKRSIVCNSRGSSMKLNKYHIISSRDGHFFSNRVINAWNSLSDYIVTSPTIACFKHRIDKLKFML